jgi:hypothetical protein
MNTDPRLFDMLVGWLGLKNARLHRGAIATFCGLGDEVVPPLVWEASKSGKTPQHRITILDVVQKIGSPLGPAEMLAFSLLLRDRNMEVRRKALRVMIAAIPVDLPKAPEDRAAMRLSNSFLPPFRSPHSVPSENARGRVRGRRAMPACCR